MSSSFFGNKFLLPVSTNNNASVDAAVRGVLASNFDADSIVCLKTLLKIVDNLLQKPGVAKVRTLKPQNPAIRSKIVDKKGHAVLLACGFIHHPQAKGQEERLVLHETTEDTELLVRTRHTLARTLIWGLGVNQDDLPITTIGQIKLDNSMGNTLGRVNSSNGSVEVPRALEKFHTSKSAIPLCKGTMIRNHRYIELKSENITCERIDKYYSCPYVDLVELAPNLEVQSSQKLDRCIRLILQSVSDDRDREVLKKVLMQFLNTISEILADPSNIENRKIQIDEASEKLLICFLNMCGFEYEKDLQHSETVASKAQVIQVGSRVTCVLKNGDKNGKVTDYNNRGGWYKVDLENGESVNCRKTELKLLQSSSSNDIATEAAAMVAPIADGKNGAVDRPECSLHTTQTLVWGDGADPLSIVRYAWNTKTGVDVLVRARQALIQALLYDCNIPKDQFPIDCWDDVDGVDNQNGNKMLFYKRDAVKEIWRAIDTARTPTRVQNVLFFQGQPGTGKSTAVWRKVFDFIMEGDNVVWVSLAYNGHPSNTLYFNGKRCFPLHFKTSELVIDFLYYCVANHLPMEAIVVDGTSNESPASDICREVVQIIQKRNMYAIFTASTKVETERNHRNYYMKIITVHSWTIEEYEKALFNGSEYTELYGEVSHLFKENKAEDFEDYVPGPNSDYVNSAGAKTVLATTTRSTEDSQETSAKRQRSSSPQRPNVKRPRIKKLSDEQLENFKMSLEARYKYAGGCALWMFNYSNQYIVAELRNYCWHSSVNMRALLDGSVGPTSVASTNCFFGSHRSKENETEYFMVSQMAVALLRKRCGTNSFRLLYDFAKRLENPSFADWIIEADFFHQLERIKESGLHEIKLGPVTPFLPAISILSFDHIVNKNIATQYQNMPGRKNKARARGIASKYVNTEWPFHVSKEETLLASVACKPLIRNQGGYDVFFVEACIQNKKVFLNLRFGQITRGKTHSFKGKYVQEVVGFFEAAGYAVKEVDFIFILTKENFWTFKLEKKEVEDYKFLCNYGWNGGDVRNFFQKTQMFLS